MKGKTEEHKRKLSLAMEKVWKDKNHRKKMVKKQEDLGFRLKTKSI
jgi:hypothetical protein